MGGLGGLHRFLEKGEMPWKLNSPHSLQERIAMGHYLLSDLEGQGLKDTSSPEGLPPSGTLLQTHALLRLPPPCSL